MAQKKQVVLGRRQGVEFCNKRRLGSYRGMESEDNRRLGTTDASKHERY